MSDPLMDHLEFRGGCMDDEIFEPEPECDDQLHAALAAAYSQLSVTCVDQIKEPRQ